MFKKTEKSQVMVWAKSLQGHEIKSQNQLFLMIGRDPTGSSWTAGFCFLGKLLQAATEKLIPCKHHC